MPAYDGLTGPITFDSKGRRANFTIDIHRISFNMPITKVCNNLKTTSLFHILLIFIS